MELMDVFRKNYLVYGLPDEVIDQIAALAEFKTALAGEPLIQKGEKSSDLYVILDGHLNVMTPKGEKLAEVGAPSVLGEVSLVDDQPRSADVVCIGLVKYARLPAPDLRKFIGQNKEHGFTMLANLARVLSMRLRVASSTVEMLSDKLDPWRFST